MSRFGWAYVNSALTGAVANGPTNSVQFNSGSQVLSGSSNFTFDPVTNKVTLLGAITGSTLVISASVVSASTYLGIPAGGSTTPGDGDKSIQFNSGSTFSGSNNLTFDYTTNTLFLTGTLRADNLIVSSSQILKSGSTIFGDDASDTHQFTGSILGGVISGTTGQFTTITSQGSTITGSLIVTNNITGSIVTGSTALFTTLTASNITASNRLQVGSNASIGGNIVVFGSFAAGYASYTGSFTVPTSSYFVGMSTTGSVITASLNSVATYRTGQTIIFKDIGGFGATNNILIKPSGSQTIDGATGGVLISTNSGSITLVSDGSNQFFIVASR